MKTPEGFVPIIRSSPYLESLGSFYSQGTGAAMRLVTSSLSLDFAGSAKIGDWIETSVDLQHVGRQLGFASAYLTVDDRRIVRASGVFLRAEAREPNVDAQAATDA